MTSPAVMDLSSAKKSRALRHSIIVNHIKKVDDAIKKPDAELVESLLAQLLIKEANLMEVHGRIEVLSDSDNLEAELGVQSDFEDLIIDAKVRINRF